MSVRLTPRDDRFYALFGQAARTVAEGADVLLRLVGAPADDRVELAHQLRELEHAGDSTLHEVMQALNTSFITPFDREDIALLASRVDDVIDDIEEAGDLVVLYRLGALPPGVHTQAVLLADAAAVTAEALPRLRTLRDLDSYWIRINDLENEADLVYRELLAGLLNGDDDLRTVIKTKEVVDKLESAADALERVADVVQSIAAKES